VESASVRSARPRRLIAIGSGLAVVYVLGMLNFSTPVLRLTWPQANAFAFAVLQLIPFILLFLVLSADPFSERVLLIVLLLPAVAFGGFAGSCSIIDCETMGRGKDPSFEPIEEVPVSAGRLVVYRTNGGATTSFGIAVRQECQLLPGLRRVRPVWGLYPAYSARIRVLAPDRVAFSSPPYEDRRPKETVEEVKLAPFWCPTD
jgi:hypothetical protein